MARKTKRELPPDVLAMSLSEVRAAYEKTDTPDWMAFHEQLVSARDKAQHDLEEHAQRKYDLLEHYSDLLRKTNESKP